METYDFTTFKTLWEKGQLKDRFKQEFILRRHCRGIEKGTKVREIEKTPNGVTCSVLGIDAAEELANTVIQSLTKRPLVTALFPLDVLEPIGNEPHRFESHL